MILDPSPARADLPDELFPLIDIMKPNEKELSILTGMPTETDEEIKAAADALLEKGVSKVVVTLGARGAMLADGNEKLFFEQSRLYLWIQRRPELHLPLQWSMDWHRKWE